MMRVLIQRVTEASVAVAGVEGARIGRGLLILVGVEAADTGEDSAWLAGKVARMRLFADEAGAMNQCLAEVAGEVLVVSQFTLHASTRKGNRPSFIRAARPEQAILLYQQLVADLGRETGRPVATGRFGADMRVSLVNDGPVTIWMDSKERE
jgi:D-tyrosyl-tRNA(Tyr) deacylase